MDLMGLLFNIALKCFHILAWPLLALCYPLCASVQAIDNGSHSDIEKLITYWVCFSLILLFEHAFQQLLEWLPHWPYLKLIIVVCLVTPHFHGSFYIYNHLVHPCLSINPRLVFNWLIKLLKQDDPLTEPKGTEPQALQNLIGFKATFGQPKLQQEDNNAEEITEKKESLVTNSVKKTEPEITLSDNATFDPLKIDEMNAAGGGRDLPDLTACNKKPQNEWTCVVCQVIATSEAGLISHLQGKRHAGELEKVKPAKEQPLEAKVSKAQASAETSDTKISHETWTCVLCKVKCNRKADLISHFQGQRHEKALDNLKAKPNAKYFFKPWTCGICQVILKNKNDLILHLEGKRHLAACERQKMESGKDEVSSEDNSILPSKELEHDQAMNLKSGLVEVRDCQWWCTICNVSCSGEGNMNQHLNGRMHLAAAMLPSGAADVGQQ